mmetsp:Transcript_56544/g.134723  ORF Transcript_56544/g.134723 Transcript_56544/m.134723 type:complete len:235 (+) Transcript_56544:326-1030(+)
MVASSPLLALPFDVPKDTPVLFSAASASTAKLAIFLSTIFLARDITKEPTVRAIIQYTRYAKISIGVGWSCQPNNALMSTKKRLVLSLQHSVASKTALFCHGRFSLPPHVPNNSSSCQACIDIEKKPAAMKSSNIEEARMKFETFILLVPAKKQQPTSLARISAEIMGIGSELRSSRSVMTPAKKTMDSSPSRRPVVKASTKKACFLPKAASLPSAAILVLSSESAIRRRSLSS